MQPWIQGQQQQPQVEPVVNNTNVILVNRNQNADEMVRNVQQNNLAGQNNIANVVEDLLAKSSLNVGLHR
jgi:hypothetical protein